MHLRFKASIWSWLCKQCEKGTRRCPHICSLVEIEKRNHVSIGTTSNVLFCSSASCESAAFFYRHLITTSIVHSLSFIKLHSSCLLQSRKHKTQRPTTISFQLVTQIFKYQETHPRKVNISKIIYKFPLYRALTLKQAFWTAVFKRPLTHVVPVLEAA